MEYKNPLENEIVKLVREHEQETGDRLVSIRIDWVQKHNRWVVMACEVRKMLELYVSDD